MYSSSKWPCLLILLQLLFGSRCSEPTTVTNTKEDQQENHSFVVSVCLTVKKQIQLSSGVLISKNRVMTACRPYMKPVSQNGQVTLPSANQFEVWAGHSKENGQWRSVVNLQCTNSSVSTSTIVWNDIGILVVQDEFELSDSFSPIGVTAIMKAEELTTAMKFRIQCKVITWIVKFKAERVPDLENRYLKGCPVETINVSSCADFLSAEVAEISNQNLIAGNLMCAIPETTSNGSCFVSILPGSPVICSEKLLGIVSLAKDPALVDTFPVVLTTVNLKTYITLSNLGRTILSRWYSALISLVLNTFLLK